MHCSIPDARTLLLALLLLVHPAAGAGDPAAAEDGPFLRSPTIPTCSRRGRLSPAAGVPEASELAVGDWHVIPDLCPAEPYFPTAVRVTPGATYRFSAVGRWKDWWISSGPEGYWLPLVQAGNRLRWRRMFVLSASVGKGSRLRFVIGRGREWQAPESLPADGDRRLYLFPNDWEGLYHNNRMVPADQGGPLRVSIQRIS